MEIETSKILNQYPSEEVYYSLKKDITNRYNHTKSEMEDVNELTSLLSNIVILDILNSKELLTNVNELTSMLSWTWLSTIIELNNVIDEFIKVLNNCEFARFAPGDESLTMDKIYKEAIEIISKTENELK